MVDGLFSAVATLGVVPIIKCPKVRAFTPLPVSVEESLDVGASCPALFTVRGDSGSALNSEQLASC